MKRAKTTRFQLLVLEPKAQILQTQFWIGMVFLSLRIFRSWKKTYEIQLNYKRTCYRKNSTAFGRWNYLERMWSTRSWFPSEFNFHCIPNCCTTSTIYILHHKWKSLLLPFGPSFPPIVCIIPFTKKQLAVVIIVLNKVWAKLLELSE